MKKLLQLFIPMALCTGLCHAQTFKWAKGIGDADFDQVWGLTTDGAGNVLATGSFKGAPDFDPGAGTYTLTSNGGTDVFVMKLDGNGNFVWAKSFGSTADDRGGRVQTDAAGNVYVMGLFAGTVDFDPGAGVYNMTSKSGTYNDVFVVKLDAAGNFVWAVQRQSQTAANGIFDYDLKLDAGNNLYMSYGFNPHSGSDSITIEKATATGATTWRKSFGITNTIASPFMVFNSLAVDGSGNVFVTGDFGGEVNFDPGGINTMMAVNGPCAYVLKLTSSGSFAWVKMLESAPGALCRGLDIATDGSGNILVAGRYAGTVDFDPGTAVLNRVGASVNAYVLKLDPAGNFIWVKDHNTSGYNQALALTTDAFGYIYYTGSFYDSINVGTVASPVTVHNVGTTMDVFTVKLANNGSLEWVYHAGGGDGDEGEAVAADNKGGVYTGGLFRQSANFDFTSSSGYTLTSNGENDAFIAKLSGCSAPVNTAVSVSGSTITAAATGATYQWFNCGTGLAVPGATGKTFTATVTGNYKVAVIQGGCVDTSGCQSVTGTGVADIYNGAAAIYPNPTAGDISIELNKSYGKVEVTITSAMGALISKAAYHDTRSINTHVDGAAGIYFISITADGETIARERLLKAN